MEPHFTVATWITELSDTIKFMQKYKTLEEFFSDLKQPRASEVTALRKIITETESELIEKLKWNAPSYSYHHDDRITFNMFNPGVTRLVFHAGAKTKEDKNAPPVFEDETGLLEWNSNIRATVSFNSVEKINESKHNLIKIIKKWLEVFD